MIYHVPWKHEVAPYRTDWRLIGGITLDSQPDTPAPRPRRLSRGFRQIPYHVTGLDQHSQPTSEIHWFPIHWRKAKRLARRGVEVRG